MLVKVVIVVLTVAAMVSFMRQVSLQPHDPRIPLAELFVWVQVLHGFDLPRSKDLLLSLVSSLVLLALAGSFALSASFGLIILLWLAAALPALYHIQVSRLRKLSVEPERSSVSGPGRKHVVGVLVALLIAVSMGGLAVGAFVPRINNNYLRSLPFSIRRAFVSADGYRFANPGYPDLPASPPESALVVNPEAYFGFGTFLDLRARGTLIDLPVMKVRCSEPSYWSGLYFREYNGHAWLNPAEEPRELSASTQPFDITYDPIQPHAATRTVVQTFYLEAEQPNVIFASYRPSLLYYPADHVYQAESGLKSPFSLDSGLVYSAISSHIVAGKPLLSARMEVKEGTLLPYLELPQMPERVLRLAGEIVPDGTGPYVRALAIEDFLREEYEYSLDVPELPSGADAVDFFLFEHRRGYCEHFASAYAVLCRLSGIPSRVVTGYSSGDYNPFTGLYEVSLDDAHAWVEIYLEGIGWVTREPTPGFSLPDHAGGSGSLWVLRDFLSWAGRNISMLFPAPLRSALRSGLAAVASAASSLASGFLYSVREAPWLLLPLAFIVLLLPLAWAVRRLGRAKPPPRELDGPVIAMRDFLRGLPSLGFERAPSQTAGEFMGSLSSAVPGLNLSGELLLFERARYGPRPLPENDALRLRRGLDAALEHVRSCAKERGRRHMPGGGEGD